MTRLCCDLYAGHTRLLTDSNLPICFGPRANGKVNGALRLHNSNSTWAVGCQAPSQIELEHSLWS